MGFKEFRLQIIGCVVVVIPLFSQGGSHDLSKNKCLQSYLSLESNNGFVNGVQNTIEAQNILTFFSASQKPFDKLMLEQVLFITKDYQKDIERLEATLKEYEKYPFFIRLQNGSKKTLNIYRNPDFLNDVEYKVSSVQNSTSENIQVNLVYGYRKSDNDSGEKILGKISSLELDKNGQLKTIVFSSEKQMKHFQKHFLGSIFSAEKKQKILDINTEIFQELRKIPEAIKKVEDFEKSRGWPPGTAENLGLAYYSKDLFDVKKWARQKWETQNIAISFKDLHNAGWLKMEFGSKGEVLFKENYDDSIKIPLFDKQDPSKISSWRTRNLRKNSQLPKYLSWPKDKSLYEGEPLIQEVYNLWNIEQVHGKKMIITEGEFKCAIGQMKTGIFHLGLPGISQFSPSLRQQIFEAQPSEVIVLFDKDPKGKALFRIDMVTDSERAAYSIAKDLKNMGLNAKVAYLPDVNQGGKLGLDDLILDKGTEPYLQALAQAVSPDEFAKQKNIDVPLTELTQRNNKLKKIINIFRRSMDSTKGFVSVDDYKTLQRIEGQSEILNSALKQYTQQVYSRNTGIQNVNPKIKSINEKSAGSSQILSRDQEYPIMDEVLVLDKAKLSPASSIEVFRIGLEYIFPADDYTFIEKVTFKNQNYSFLIVRKDDQKPIALVTDEKL